MSFKDKLNQFFKDTETDTATKQELNKAIHDAFFPTDEKEEDNA